MWSVNVVVVNRALCHIYDILYRGSLFLDEATQAELEEAVHEYCISYSVLRRIAEERGHLYFHMSPKCHTLAHLPSQCRLINSRWLQVYGEESLMGHVSKIWASVARGRYQRSAQLSVCCKYLVNLAIALEL